VKFANNCHLFQAENSPLGVATIAVTPAGEFKKGDSCCRKVTNFR